MDKEDRKYAQGTRSKVGTRVTGVSDPGGRAEGLSETHPVGRKQTRSPQVFHAKSMADSTESRNHRTHRLASILERSFHLQLT